MRRKCINICKEQREKGVSEDPILSPVEQNGITMHALRRLAELASKNSSSTGTNRNFGVLQEVHRDANEVVFSQSQGLPLPPSQSTGLQFSICGDNETGEVNQAGLPWKRFEGVSAQSKENERVTEKWSVVRLSQKPGSIKKQAAPFAVYSEVRMGIICYIDFNGHTKSSCTNASTRDQVRLVKRSYS